jgi:hypothetical protein
MPRRTTSTRKRPAIPCFEDRATQVDEIDLDPAGGDAFRESLEKDVPALALVVDGVQEVHAEGAQHLLLERVRRIHQVTCRITSFGVAPDRQEADAHPHRGIRSCPRSSGPTPYPRR